MLWTDQNILCSFINQLCGVSVIVVFVQLLSCVQLFVTPWTAACQASLSFTISWSLLKFMSIESVMPSNHLIPCCPLLLPFIFPSITVFSVIHLFTSGGQSIGASSSGLVLPTNIQSWFPLGLTGLVTLLSKELWRVFSSTIIWKYQFVTQPSKPKITLYSPLSCLLCTLLCIGNALFFFFFYLFISKFCSEGSPMMAEKQVGRPLSPPQIHQKIIWMLSNFHKTTSECSRRTPAPRKAAHSLQKEVVQNIKDKNINKKLGLKTHPGERVVKEETLSQVGLWGVWNLRGQHNWEKKTNKPQNTHLIATASRGAAQMLASDTSQGRLSREARLQHWCLG